MNRKSFIFLTVAGVATLAIPIAGCRHYSDALVNTLGRPDFLGHICDAKTIDEIGSAYRNATPDESRMAGLIELLLKDMQRAGDDPRLAQQIKDRVRQDFAANDVVIVKGWVLSRTEARQCALYSFSLQ